MVDVVWCGWCGVVSMVCCGVVRCGCCGVVEVVWCGGVWLMWCGVIVDFFDISKYDVMRKTEKKYFFLIEKFYQL